MASATIRGVSPDPLDVMLEQSATQDHAKAAQRGERVLRVTNAAINGLISRGLLAPADEDDARVAVFSLIADDLYGNAAIDVPRLRRRS